MAFSCFFDEGCTNQIGVIQDVQQRIYVVLEAMHVDIRPRMAIVCNKVILFANIQQLSPDATAITCARFNKALCSEATVSSVVPVYEQAINNVCGLTNCGIL
jgi:hypothetical protein